MKVVALQRVQVSISIPCGTHWVQARPWSRPRSPSRIKIAAGRCAAYLPSPTIHHRAAPWSPTSSYPREELNLCLFVRTELFSPLNYEGKKDNQP